MRFLTWSWNKGQRKEGRETRKEEGREGRGKEKKVESFIIIARQLLYTRSWGHKAAQGRHRS